MIDSNPVEDFGLAAPTPRDHVWDEDGGHADDELMGIIVTQRKTSKPVGIPILRPLRTRIEAAFEVNAKSDRPIADAVPGRGYRPSLEEAQVH